MRGADLLMNMSRLLAPPTPGKTAATRGGVQGKY